jgi:hypothetical protein
VTGGLRQAGLLDRIVLRQAGWPDRTAVRVWTAVNAAMLALLVPHLTVL